MQGALRALFLGLPIGWRLYGQGSFGGWPGGGPAGKNDNSAGVATPALSPGSAIFSRRLFRRSEPCWQWAVQV